MFWLEENLTLSNVLITGESNFDEKNVEEMFNWSEVHWEKKYYLWNRDFIPKYKSFVPVQNNFGVMVPMHTYICIVRLRVA